MAESTEVAADSIPFVTEDNVSTHLGEEKSMLDVLVLMIDKLRANIKTVDSLKKPQILVLTQNTLKVVELYKALRDKYQLSNTPKVSKKK